MRISFLREGLRKWVCLGGSQALGRVGYWGRLSLSGSTGIHSLQYPSRSCSPFSIEGIFLLEYSVTQEMQPWDCRGRRNGLGVRGSGYRYCTSWKAGLLGHYIFTWLQASHLPSLNLICRMCACYGVDKRWWVLCRQGLYKDCVSNLFSNRSGMGNTLLWKVECWELAGSGCY